jgi:micrococcal nuclease
VKRILSMSVAGILIFGLIPVDANARRRKPKTPPQFVILDGVRERVFWNDGDSFRILRGPRKGIKARLDDYNTLESYGPVHFWGAFDAWEMYKLAKSGTYLARGKTWDCRLSNSSGGYGRKVVHCPGLSKAILRAGFAHVFTVGKTKPAAKLLKYQLEAQNKRLGIWKKGIPSRIVTSIHSMNEPTGDGSLRTQSYNRVCDTRTGRSWLKKHTATFKPCDTWCHGGSCMIYVPFLARYGKDRPGCMRQGWKSRMTAPPHLGYPMKKGSPSIMP